MSQDASWNPDWWKAEKARSLDRRAATIRGKAARPGDSFLIVTEGTVTEPTYFNLLRTELRLGAVQIQVEPGEASDPRHVVKTAVKLRDKQIRLARKGKLASDQPGIFDQVWAVIDTDRAVRDGFWHEVMNLARDHKINLAHSTPCFEYWLILHLEYGTPCNLHDGTAAKKAFEKRLGRDYSTNQAVAKEALGTITKLWADAVKHARSVRTYHLNSVAKPPANPSTEVDLLVSAISEARPTSTPR